MKANERLNKLPKKIQEEVLQVLKGGQGAYVELNEITCEYRVTTGNWISTFYNPWRVVEYFDDEIYTHEEQKANSADYWRGVDMSDF